MGTKRSRTESGTVHPSRQAQVPGSISRPTKKPRKLEPPQYKKQVHASSINAIKKRIRDVARRLERSQNLPANVRVEDERALAAYDLELAAAVEEKTRQKMIRKYHMVRFFERQKASRQLKKLRKRLLETQSPEDIDNIKAEMHIAEVDLNYAQNYPLSEPYISLYPQKSLPANENVAQNSQEHSMAKKPSLWAEIERRMIDGTLDQLRNRVRGREAGQRITPVSHPSQPKPKAMALTSQAQPQAFVKAIQKHSNKATPKNRPAKSGRERQNLGIQPGLDAQTDDNIVDDNSDGGFFEE